MMVMNKIQNILNKKELVMKNEEKYYNYIVPIYVEGKYNGTGFIVEDYLISAAHVVKDNPAEVLFIYHDKEIKLCKYDVYEYHDFRNGHALMDDNIKTDLVIYHIPAKFEIHSNLILSMNSALGKSCQYMGYNEDTKGNIIEVNYKDIHIVDDAAIGDNNNPTIEKINCYTSDKSVLEEGNSGGPIFLNEKIAGMLYASKVYGNEDRFIQSFYIQMVIDKLKYNTKKQ